MRRTAVTTIALVRHGQTDWNATGRFQGSSDIALNPAGRAQAREAADRLRSVLPGNHWSVVRHSPLRRAGETGEIIAAALGIGRARVLPALVERDWGAAEGLTLDECLGRWPQLAGVDPLAARELFPGVEPADLVVSRGRFAAETLIEQYPGENVVATSHGTLLRLTLSDLLDRPFDYVPNGGVVVVQAWLENSLLRTRLVAKSFEGEEDDPTQAAAIHR